MRKRLRSWPQMVYKFKVYSLKAGSDLTKDLPQEFWDIAKNMQKLWNALCDLREEIFPENWYKPYIPEGGSKPEGEWYKEEYKARGEKLQKAARKLQQSYGELLPWDCRQEVEDRFFRACTRGATKKHFRLDRINIPYIDKVGGSSVDRVFTYKDSRLRTVYPVPEKAYEFATRPNDQQHKMMTITPGRFDMGNAHWEFRVRIHRQIPKDVFIKRIHWIGERSALGWQWYWALTVEYPPEIVQARAKKKDGKVCALDLGWRKFDDYLRIGLLVDQHGKVEEIKLPLVDTSYRAKSAGKERYSTDRRWNDFNDWRKLADYQSMIATKMDICKEIVRETLTALLAQEVTSSSADAVQQLKQMMPKMIFDKIRDRGLLKILRLLQEAALLPDLQIVIKDWQQQNRFHCKRLEQARQHWIRKRDHLYFEIAHSICKRYSKIVWEKDLRIKEMAESDTTEYSLIESGKYRQFAAIGRFREIFKQTVEKYDCELLEAKTAHSTDICSICGTLLEVNASLVLHCPLGHNIDQDINAALNLGSQFFDKFKSKEVLLAASKSV